MYSTRFNVKTIDGKRYILGYQSNSNIIYYTDYDKGESFQKIVFEREGPNGIRRVQAVDVVNFDSIFVLEKHSFIIYLSNAKAEIIKKWDVKSFKGVNDLFGIGASSWRFPLKYDNGKLYVKFIPPYYTNSTRFYTSKHLGVLDLESNKISAKLVSFPSNYTSGVDFGNYNFLLNLDYAPNKIFVSYSSDEQFDVYNKNGLVKSYLIPSRLAPKMNINPEVKNLSKRGSDENDRFEIPRTSYRFIKYDQFRNIIYRIVMLPSELYDKDGFRVKLYDKPFIVQMLSAENYHILGEYKLPGNTYDVKNIIPLKEGLLISLANNNNPDLEEDRLRFQLFSILQSK